MLNHVRTSEHYLEEANELLAAGEYAKAQAVATVGLLVTQVQQEKFLVKEFTNLFEGALVEDCDEDDDDLDPCFFDCSDCEYRGDCEEAEDG